MWRAILVDDEEYVRAELASLFPWQQHRFDLVGEAENAHAAMELIEKNQPDLVITDIRMAEMDGLALISWIKQHHPEIMVAVVSAYNDFTFVREALRLGAVDYLIKAEATVETAGDFLNRIDELLERYYSVLSDHEEITSNMAKYHQLAVQSFWRDALTRASDEQEIRQRAGELDIGIENARFGLIFIHIFNYRAFPENVQQTLRLNLEKGVQTHWEWDWNIIDFKRGDFVFVYSLLNETPEIESINKLHDIAKEVAWNFPEKVAVSASSKFGSFLELPRNFQEVREVNLLRLYRPEARYYEAAELIKLQNGIDRNQISELLPIWERLLRSAVQEEMNHFLDNLFQTVIPNNMSPNEARQLVLDFINVLRRISLEYQIHTYPHGDEDQNFEQDFLRVLDEVESISDWNNCLKKMITQFTDVVKKNALPQSSAMIQKALAFIQANFTGNISLEDVAEYAGVSKSYLCRVFPDYTGEHFSNYLQRLRIERAKELLRFTDEHIYEVASKVGFWNSRYFSKVFHELVGMTPADYRRVLPEQE